VNRWTRVLEDGLTFSGSPRMRRPASMFSRSCIGHRFLSFPATAIDTMDFVLPTCALRFEIGGYAAHSLCVGARITGPQ
jgi:hypothetical protein